MSLSRRRIEQDLLSEGEELIETHISWVVLGARRVLKIKKPVDLGFLDFSTLDKRRRACDAEVELNRRLAPDVYDGVVPIVDVDGRLVPDAEGEPCAWAVQMRRLPDSDRADVRLRAGRLDRDGIARIADRIAAFHGEARTDEEVAAFGTPAAIEHNVRENFSQTRSYVSAFIRLDHAAEVERGQLEFIRRNRRWLEARAQSRRVVEGHGDLRLEHVYIDDDGEIRIIDCIEFNDRFRCGDVIGDIAFLAMDLHHAGRSDLAEALVAAYAEETGDYEGYRGLDFYLGYRAWVRAKVDTLVAVDAAVDAEQRDEAERRARRHYLQAVAVARVPLLTPRLVAVGGVIASGKTTIAKALAERLDAPRISSDVTRKRILGVRPSERLDADAFGGGYSTETTRHVYATMLDHADAVLAAGRSVVLDASFRTRASRREAWELAESYEAPFSFFECRAPDAVCRRRLADRGEDVVSDARPEIFDAFVASYVPPTEAELPGFVRLNTGGPVSHAVTRAMVWIPEVPDRLTG